MARTTDAELVLVIGTIGSSAERTAFIDDASLWVDTHLVGACTALTATLLTEIEKYVAAYYLSVKYPALVSKQVGDVSETYVRDPKTNPFLVIASGLDPCGIVQDMIAKEAKTKGKAYVGAGYVSAAGGT